MNHVDASISYRDSIIGEDPAARQARDDQRQQKALMRSVAPFDPGNH